MSWKRKPKAEGDARLEGAIAAKKGQTRSAQPNAKELHALVERRVEAHRKAMHDVVDGMIEVHGALTPKQREQIALLVEERLAKR